MRQFRLESISSHLQTSQALNALVKNGIDPETIRLFSMEQNPDCVYELTPSCAEDPANLTPSDREGTGLFGDMFGGMFV